MRSLRTHSCIVLFTLLAWRHVWFARQINVAAFSSVHLSESLEFPPHTYRQRQEMFRRFFEAVTATVLT